MYFAEFFHLSPELSMSIKETSVIYNQALQEANDDLVKETSLRLYEFARLIIETRKAEPWDPAEDPTSALLQARGNDGELLPENLVLGTIRQMIVVGMIAPSVMIGCILVHLAQHPEVERAIAERSQSNSGGCRRISASVHALPRICPDRQARCGIWRTNHSQG